MEYAEFDTLATLRIFDAEVARCEGTLGDNYRDDCRLFARSVLPLELDAQPKDAFNAGVALRQIENRVVVYPFIHRQVCKNGQVMAHGSNRRADVIEITDRFEAEVEIREAIQACLAPEIFPEVIEEVRKSVRDTADFLMTELPKVKRKLTKRFPELADKILRRYQRRESKSRFGLMNAVTAIARGVTDPQVRWDLEELGGAIGAGLPIDPPERPSRAKAVGGRRKKRKEMRERAKRSKRESRVKV